MALFLFIPVNSLWIYFQDSWICAITNLHSHSNFAPSLHLSSLEKKTTSNSQRRKLFPIWLISWLPDAWFLLIYGGKTVVIYPSLISAHVYMYALNSQYIESEYANTTKQWKSLFDRRIPEPTYQSNGKQNSGGFPESIDGALKCDWLYN